MGLKINFLDLLKHCSALKYGFCRYAKYHIIFVSYLVNITFFHSFLLNMLCKQLYSEFHDTFATIEWNLNDCFIVYFTGKQFGINLSSSSAIKFKLLSVNRKAKLLFWHLSQFLLSIVLEFNALKEVSLLSYCICIT